MSEMMTDEKWLKAQREMRLSAEHRQEHRDFLTESLERFRFNNQPNDTWLNVKNAKEALAQRLITSAQYRIWHEVEDAKVLVMLKAHRFELRELNYELATLAIVNHTSLYLGAKILIGEHELLLKGLGRSRNNVRLWYSRNAEFMQQLTDVQLVAYRMSWLVREEPKSTN